MFKQIALGAGLAVLLAGPVMAQQAQTPSTPDDCLQAAFELAVAPIIVVGDGQGAG